MNTNNEIVVDSTLTLQLGDNHGNPKAVLNALSLEGKMQVISNDLRESDNDMVFHSNYMDYIHRCWSSHAGIVIRPSDIWFVMVSQLAKHFKDPTNADAYRSHFSQSKEKEQLVFVVSDPDQLEINMILAALGRRIKLDLNMFCPEFSDSTPRNREAIAASFCEAMEAYYEYCTDRCGISKVRVEGTREDWHKIAELCTSLSQILFNAKAYLVDVAALVLELWEKRDQPETWRKFFMIKDCGSGHPNVAIGSLTRLYALNVKLTDHSSRSYFDDPAYGGKAKTQKQTSIGADLEMFKDGSQVTYKNLVSETTYKKTYGIMSSILDSRGYLIPIYNYVLLKEMSAEEVVLKHVPENIGQILKRLGPKTHEEKKDVLDLHEYLKDCRPWETPNKLRLIKDFLLPSPIPE